MREPLAMVTKRSLLFSQFKSQEFEEICQLLCQVFNTTSKDLANLYENINSTFEEPGWPLHFVSRDFFQSSDYGFRSIYQRSPVISVDLPSLMELNDGKNNKPTVAIIGQDSKQNSNHIDLLLGTPYGLHHKGSREELSRTKLYFEMIQAVLELGYRVYLTDIFKIWVCDPNRPYNGINLPFAEQNKFHKLIKPELAIVKPDAVITWGKVAGDGVNKLLLGIKHLNFPHPSGAANGAWKDLIGDSPTNFNKLNYWRKKMAQELKNGQ